MKLSDVMPSLRSEWDFEENAKKGLDFYKVTDRSGLRASWICKNGHKWEAVIGERVYHKTGCPYCSGRLAISGVNDLETLYPEIAKEWDDEKNFPMEPATTKPYIYRKVFWKCNKGHSYFTSVNSRTKKNVGCPYCSGRKALPGKTDLFTLHPELKTIWNDEKNIGIDPYTIRPGSTKTIWWICELNHEWQAKVEDIVKGQRCPYCSGQRIMVGFNDLATIRPDIANQWDYEKNAPLLPTQVTVGSTKTVWWICQRGHHYRTSINNRTNPSHLTIGCPECANKISLPEKYLFQMFKLAFPDAESNVRPHFLKRMEYDGYSADSNTAFEYNGAYFHEGKEKSDFQKVQISKEQGIVLFRVLEYVPDDLQETDIIIDKGRYASIMPDAAKKFKRILEAYCGHEIDDASFNYDYAEFLKEQSFHKQLK